MNLVDDHPRSGFAAPPEATEGAPSVPRGNASGPAEPDPRRLLGNAVVDADGIGRSCAGKASPAQALERAFGSILQRQMQDMPMLNPALAVEAVGFRPWCDHWLGILVTPWFMNLVLMPRVSAKWQPIGERETRHYVFPAGVFEFIGGSDPALGDYQACSLFSPMFEFGDSARGARHGGGRARSAVRSGPARRARAASTGTGVERCGRPCAAAGAARWSASATSCSGCRREPTRGP